MDAGAQDVLGTDVTTADVVVVGAGLAGLSAAATAAAQGADVVVLDAHARGGRARTTVVEPGVTFNSGPRAWYLGGAGAAALDTLGIVPRGSAPLASTGHVLVGGRRQIMPATAGRLLRTRALGARSKVAVAGLLGKVPRMDPASLRGRSVAQWLGSLGLAPDAAALVRAIVRLATYIDDPEHLDASVAVAQLQMVLGTGVLYLDGGFEQLVASLLDAAARRGAQVREHAEVRSIEPSAGPGTRWVVHTSTGTLRARSVVLAAGSPAACASLSPVPLDRSQLSEPVTAACLELAVRGVPATPFLLGVDQPLYLSQHSPPADLAPEGISVVHVLRYGTTDDAQHDRDELWGHAAAAGIDARHVVAQRFLRRMVVTGTVPTAASGGLAGRPAVRVPGADGLLLAGDWAGDEGLLADAAVASGARAGRLAASTTERHVSVAGTTG